ncbi:hypothetical protein ACIGEP_14700 [Microbacterium sp. NPDC077663]|uniref:hypothetical protein n=1 Tax=Microbacterium sp. NPDC077663 TaxID=3364189 RepID=UPI0037C732B6
MTVILNLAGWAIIAYVALFFLLFGLGIAYHQRHPQDRPRRKVVLWSGGGGLVALLLTIGAAVWWAPDGREQDTVVAGFVLFGSVFQVIAIATREPKVELDLTHTSNEQQRPRAQALLVGADKDFVESIGWALVISGAIWAILAIWVPGS